MAMSRFKKADMRTTREIIPRQKSVRARTGCFTCRDRHIKCDEALPNCKNCAKSKRFCERGTRLNFLIPIVHRAPQLQLTSGQLRECDLVIPSYMSLLLIATLQ